VNKDKAYFLPRIVAYFIDALIISIIVSFLTFPFSTKSVESLQNDLNSVSDKYMSNEISMDEYLNQSLEITYDLNYSMIPITIIDIASLIVYFIVFQYYNKGQTIGKKIMKIKIVSNNEKELSINNYVYRSFILNGVLISILDVVLILFMNKKYYFYLSFTLQFIQIVLILVTVLMVLFSKEGRGLHDKVGNTKVIMCD